MDRATVRCQKFALGVAGHAETTQIARSVDVAFLKRSGRQFQKPRQIQNVFFGEINKPLLLAAFRAARLALKAHTFHSLKNTAEPLARSRRGEKPDPDRARICRAPASTKTKAIAAHQPIAELGEKPTHLLCDIPI